MLPVFLRNIALNQVLQYTGILSIVSIIFINEVYIERILFSKVF